jgi:hypothetical protein
VSARGLAIVWILVAAVLGVLLVLELSKWRSLATEGTQIAAERQRLSSEIGLKEQQVVLEMRKHSALLQEMQWTSVGGDPAAFLTRLAELAQEKRMRVMAIGSLERQTAPQFTKSWHTVQVQASFPEIRELAARVEREKGILEDVRLEAAPPSTGPSAAASPANELRARFRMTGLELSAAAKQIVQRAAAAGAGAAPPAAGAPPGLPVPNRAAQVGRDPFTFLLPPPPPRVAGAGPAAEKPAPPLDIKGIVTFPDGFLAIVNNQIVKVGDTVTGYRVEQITETAVTLREPGASPRTVELPGLLGAAPAAPRR